MDFDLLGDIGATASRLALARDGRILPASRARLDSRSFAGIIPLVETYLAQQGRPQLDRMCLAVAGPVNGTTSHLTNLGWDIDAIRFDHLAPGGVRLVNDVQALARALPHLPGDTRHLLRAGQPEPGAMMVAALGTGFNAAVVHPVAGGGWLAPGAEAGQIPLPLPPGFDPAPLHAAAGTAEVPTLDAILSGRGLVALDALHGPARTAPEITAAMAQGEARACRTLGIVSPLLARSLGLLALVHLPRGGIFVAGSVGRALMPLVPARDFGREMAAWGPLGVRLGDIPLHLVTDDGAALHGCAAFLADQGDLQP